MSFGKTKQQSTSQQQSTSNQALDPDLKAALLQNYNSFGQNVPGYTPYSGDKMAGFTPQQQQGFGILGNIATNQTGQAPLDAATVTAGTAANYTPQGILATPAAAGTIDPSKVQTITAGTVPGLDISKYMNPFTQNVVDTTSADAQHALQVQENQNAADATKAGAWRGSALAVQNGVAQGNSNRALDSAIATLRQNGYSQALDTATSDLNRGLTAGQANQSTALSAGTTDANNATQTALANAQAALQASTSNQNAGLTANAQRLQAAGVLGDLSTQDLTEAQSRAQGTLAAGNQQQAQQQALLDWAYQNNYLNQQQYAMAVQNLKNQTLGLAGDPTLSSSQSTGTSSGSGSGFNIGFGGGGGGPSPVAGGSGGAPQVVT